MKSSMDLRERIVKARQEGSRAVEVAERFNVSKRTLERYFKRYQSQGPVKPNQQGGYRPSPLQKHESSLKAWLEAEPGLTLLQLKERCQHNLGVKGAASTLWYHLWKLKLSF